MASLPTSRHQLPQPPLSPLPPQHPPPPSHRRPPAAPAAPSRPSAPPLYGQLAATPFLPSPPPGPCPLEPVQRSAKVSSLATQNAQRLLAARRRCRFITVSSERGACQRRAIIRFRFIPFPRQLQRHTPLQVDFNVFA